MGKFTCQELEEAAKTYNKARARASETGDWRIWAALFTEDAHYIEHAYGDFHGREEIEKWIMDVMAPFPHMDFPWEWYCIDEANDAIVFCVQNTLPHPDRKFSFPNWSRVIYAGKGLFSYQEDIYNPARTEPVFQEWLAMGGKLESEPRVEPKYR